MQTTRAYRDGQKYFPISVREPCNQQEVLLEELISDYKKVPKREQKINKCF